MAEKKTPTFNKKGMKVLFSGYRDQKHSSAGGYDKIAEYPGSTYLSDKDVPFGFMKVGQRWKFINLLCLDVATRILRCKYDITHMFYGDMIVFPYKKLRKHKLVATIHLDVTKHIRGHKLFIRALRNLDGVIVLSSFQEQQLRELGINAKFIPHGFSSPRFDYTKPACFSEQRLDGKVNIVMSGSNYRDMNTLMLAIEYAEKNIPDIMFHIMGQRDEKLVHELRMHCNVICYDRLSDDEYFSVIKSCDYSFIPLMFATANNALLEAQFLGVQSILPDIAGVEDYAAPAPLNLFYKDIPELYDLLVHLRKRGVSEPLIKYSERFLWDNVYKDLDRYYEALIQ